MRLVAVGEPVALAAIAEPDEQTRQKLELQYGVSTYGFCEEMFDREHLDAVEVLTPDAHHAEDIEAALRRGLHVLVEKPLATDLRDSWRLCELADELGLILMTGFCKRFSPPYRKAKMLLATGTIGRPSMIAAKMCQAWCNTILFENQDSHLFDLVSHLMGDVKTLQAVGVNAYGEEGYIVDNAAFLFEFKSGAIGSFYTNSSGLSLKPWERVEVFGEHRWLAVEDQLTCTLYDSETGPEKTWRPVFPHTLLLDEEFGGYVSEIRNFIRSVRGLEEPLVLGWDGHRALVLAVSARLALEERETVDVDAVARPTAHRSTS
jgi:predicted dehydrogenase